MVTSAGTIVMSALTVVLFGVFLLIAKRAIELVLEKEYASWASAAARLGLRCAGFICRSHRRDWWADLLYQQRVEGMSGLALASSCLLSAPFLAFRDGAALVRKLKAPKAAVVATNAVVWVDTHRPIEALGLSSRTLRALRAHRLATVDQLLSMREEEFFRIRNFGRTALDEVKEKIVEGGFIQPS
jgi:hypothetical protein